MYGDFLNRRFPLTTNSKKTTVVYMFELKIVTDFAAAHQLALEGRKCENLHGHNWKVEVYLRGEKLDQSGVLMDFGVIKKQVAEIMDTIDHRFLNELPIFKDNPPSSENIAFYIANELQERMSDPSIHVSRVAAWESNDACATYIRDS